MLDHAVHFPIFSPRSHCDARPVLGFIHVVLSDAGVSFKSVDKTTQTSGLSPLVVVACLEEERNDL